MLPSPSPVICPTAPATATRIGNFAPQEKNGIVLIVRVRSLSSIRVRVFTIAGTEQPKPIIIGINALPETPKRRKIPSRINATRAIYPVSSKMESKHNNTIICGTKLKTPPRPPKTPSPIRDTAHTAAPAFSRPVVIQPNTVLVNKSIRLNKITPGENITPSYRQASRETPKLAVSSSPSAFKVIKPRSSRVGKPQRLVNKKSSEKVIWKIANKITRKMGIPNHLCVRILSALSDLVFFSPTTFFVIKEE